MLKLDIKLRRELAISNVVCTADLKQHVDIDSFNNFEFLSSNLKLYRCGYVKDNKMVGRVTVFGSGKLISVGTKSPDNAILELKNASHILQNYQLIKKCKIFPKIRNIVASGKVNKKIDLHNLARILPRSMYEPEQFPGLIFRIKDSVVALIFASGKTVIVGSKTINELNNAFFELQQNLP